MEYKQTLEKRKLHFTEFFKEILRPIDQSDRTTLNRLTHWLGEECKAGRLDEEVVFGQVLAWAKEVEDGAKAGTVRNPWAVLMSILRKELGYNLRRLRTNNVSGKDKN